MVINRLIHIIHILFEIVDNVIYDKYGKHNMKK